MAKTTLEITDALFIDAKKRAAEMRKPLRSLVEEALREFLNKPQTTSTTAKKVKWMSVNAGLPGDVDLTDRENMHSWVSEE
jgi:histidinol phosphatase-like enzyme